MLAKTAGKTNHIAHSNFDYIIKSIREKDGETRERERDRKMGVIGVNSKQGKSSF